MGIGDSPGMSEISRGGFVFSPSQVYFEGILPLCSKAGLVIFIWFEVFIGLSLKDFEMFFASGEKNLPAKKKMIPAIIITPAKRKYFKLLIFFVNILPV